MLILGIPTLNRFDCLERCIDSALVGTVVPDRILIIDNSGGSCPRIDDPRIAYATPAQNLGVAKSWNALADTAFETPGAQLIISNDDIIFAPDTAVALISCAEREPRAAIVSALPGQRYSLFLLARGAWGDVGPFDEQFWPGCFEDNDWDWRARLRGWERLVAPSEIGHERSATVHALMEAGRGEWWHAHFRANEARYKAKWGGRPGKERYTVAYGTMVRP